MRDLGRARSSAQWPRMGFQLEWTLAKSEAAGSTITAVANSAKEPTDTRAAVYQ